MINNIKTQFSIKDVENLSGIKAHTIRIWEKRYTLFEPKRTETNIRYYTIDDLKKILNVAFLVEKGNKISKISKLKPEEIREAIVLETSKSTLSEAYENSILVSMLNFDQHQFEIIYNKLTNEFSFREIFNELFVPLLSKIGLQWQSNTITPAHEHFISNLVYQKLLVNIEKVSQNEITESVKVYVLFLPMNEIHELGLLFINYELNLKGNKTIYLGQSIPFENIAFLNDRFDNIIFISYFTVYPVVDSVEKYISDFKNVYLKNSNELWVSGRNTLSLSKTTSDKNIKLFKDLNEMIKSL